ncbi:Nitroreductase [Seminavis robusta]|uniref:Nitroreductase n=1 Tax=Seminavis robusta TaxID=568900 RepID=A0A9N8E8P7_9STRA|nr:Nitroreductase [Seminavis robusta]|eukprot:Sro778_g201080.1 Nitroreductase (235) ;mRNA; f:3280-3984
MMLGFVGAAPSVSLLLLLGLLFPCSRQQHQVDAFSSPSPASFHELLLSRRTINSFEAELPPYWEMKLTAAVEAATYAPNHKLTEPWRFHLLGNEAIQRVCELNAELVSSSKGPAAGAKKLERWLAMPGWLVVTQVVVVQQSDDDDSCDNPMSMAREDYAACCCAVQNLCLSLHANGMGTKWTTGPVNFDPRFAEAVGLPENERVVGTIWFGKPVSVPSAPRKKLSLDNVLIKHA